MKFIDGLKPDFKSLVLMQRPSSLDTAFVLARLQEVADPPRKKEYLRPDSGFHQRPVFTKPLPLPAPPVKVPRVSPVLSEDRRYSEAARAKSIDDRWGALLNFRRAKGLCQFCAAKWSKEHKCADTVQLHALQELMELFHVQAESFVAHSQQGDDQLFLTLSVAVVASSPSPRTMCLQGLIQGHSISILVDSGSSHTFISQHLASQLEGVVANFASLPVQVANGQRLFCHSIIPNAVWSVDDCAFSYDLKVLALSAYDMILGIDWLEKFSPMKVHWQHKWMTIPYKGSTVMLHGMSSSVPVGTILHVCQMDIMADQAALVHIPQEIQQLIARFAELFAVPTELPPSRPYDHSIPLIEEAAPIQVRPYRFAPQLKTEIEKQVNEMLANGLIHKSFSPFSYSVLLVKKKDGSWRFCVDYRQLNAITIKGKYPVLVIDEFLDELSQASWFSSLDLRAGFHQIRLKPGQEYKTAFQTHFG